MRGLSKSVLEELKAEVYEFGQQQTQQDLFDSLRTQTEAMDQSTEELANLSELVAKTELGGEVNIEISRVKDSLDRLNGQLGDGWDARDLKESNALPDLREDIDNLLEDLKGQIGIAWQNFLSDNPIPRVGELARLLRSLDIEAVDSLKVENALNRMNRSAMKPYPTREEFEEYKSDLKTAHQRAMRIGLDGSWPDSVSRFLRDVAERGADLSALDQEVLDWLDEKGLTAHFLIVPRSDLS